MAQILVGSSGGTPRRSCARGLGTKKLDNVLDGLVVRQQQRDEETRLKHKVAAENGSSYLGPTMLSDLAMLQSCIHIPGYSNPAL